MISSSYRSEEALVLALRAGEEAAFMALVEEYDAPLRRFAGSFVRSAATAEEVVQEAWLGVLRGIDRFEERSSLKTWLYRIVANTAKTRAVREARSIPFSALDDEPSVPADRFQRAGDVHPGGWVTFPQSWAELPEARLEARETAEVIAGAIGLLPDAQRIVIELRDVQGFAAEEVCNVLEISETNQRVLLHRARSKVRAALERYFTMEST